MLRQFKNPNFYIIAAIDIFMCALALTSAYMIRFDFAPSSGYIVQMLHMMPYTLSLKLVVFYILGMYRGMWRYTSISDMFDLAKAVALSSLIIAGGILFVNRFQGFSRGVILLDAILTFAFTGGVRIFLRVLHHRGFLGHNHSAHPSSADKQRKKRVIMVGAGDAAEKAFREISENPDLSLEVIGFVDDNPAKQGRSIHRIPVLGKVQDLSHLVKKRQVDELIIAMPSASGSQMRAVVDVCDKTGVTYKTLPGLGELIYGKVSVKALRDISYADLLGRPAVDLDIEGITNYLHNKTVLITGPGGSIGSELCRQIAQFSPARMILFDSSEPSLYTIEMELEHQIRYLDYVPVLGAVQKEDLTRRIFKRYRPEVVFHAAAYKHVPLLEQNPWQAVWNNVCAAQKIMSLSTEYNVERFILVSTDKAVKPANVMGASKRCCEKMMYIFNGGHTRFMAVRFGNVVGSAGSVIPLFRKQIEMGGPVTVTHPEMTRYFMTIAEASQLILQAGAQGEGQELFVLEMGTPVNIAEMAKDLIRLSGKEPDQDIEIVFSKPRPGEKLYEELITAGEGVVRTSHEKIMVIRPESTFQGFVDQAEYRKWLMSRLESLYLAADTYDAGAIKKGLQEIVPEYELQE